NLQGASHTSGGIICGWAIGNTFNLADAPGIQDDANFLFLTSGKVYLYSASDSLQLDPTRVKPDCVLKIDVSPSLAPILTKVARKYSPIHGMTGSNIHIYTFEENEWNIKGGYETAVEDDDDIRWMVIGKGNVLPIWLVSIKSDIFIKVFTNLFWIGKRSTI
ncbi:hypothetical protein BYT27DRAFT_7085865, partial [Phlegmacium glaucopus]